MLPAMDPHALHRRFGFLLRPLASPYALLMRARRELYAKGSLESFMPPCPCVAVGNIAWGGTGKTPFVSSLLEWAQKNSLRAVVLSRGYGARPGEAPLLVNADTLPEQAGDEPLLLARAHPEAHVVVFPRRAEAARFALERLNPDIFILDDGMQHLAIGRHADIVLLRPEDLDDQWNAVIPAGSWREGESALQAASAFGIKSSANDFAALTPLLHQRLEGLRAPIFSFTVTPERLSVLGTAGEAVPMEHARGTGYILASGVGNPALLEKDAAAFLGRLPVKHFAFADHHAYTSQNMAALCAPDLPVVCTAKDAVKLAPLLPQSAPPFWVLESRLVFGPSLFTPLAFPQWWEERWHIMRRQTAGI